MSSPVDSFTEGIIDDEESSQDDKEISLSFTLTIAISLLSSGTKIILLFRLFLKEIILDCEFYTYILSFQHHNFFL